MFTFYNNESLRKLVAGFGTLFNDMYIGKYNDDGDLIEKNRVPLTYGPKEKFIRRIKCHWKAKWVGKPTNLCLI